MATVGANNSVNQSTPGGGEPTAGGKNNEMEEMKQTNANQAAQLREQKKELAEINRKMELLLKNNETCAAQARAGEN